MNRFLCFSAHPDDAEFVCTGTLIKLIRAGWDGSLVVITNGENGFKTSELSRQERIATRHREQRTSADKLGIARVEFLEFRDGFLEESEGLRSRLVEVIREHRPDVVFSFDPANQAFDNINLFHRDHRIAARVVFDALFAARNRWMYRGEPHAVAEVHFYGTYQPNRFVDISDVIDLKIEALACHASQFPDFAKVEAFVRDEISGPHEDHQHCERFRAMEVGPPL